MADKRLSIANKVFLIILLCLLCGLSAAIFGCASQAKQQMDSNHYVVQVQQGYPCPECGHQIPMENISANIRIENKCPNCQKVFFGAPLAQSAKSHDTTNIPHRGLLAGYNLLGFRTYTPYYEIDSEVIDIGGRKIKETDTSITIIDWWFYDRKYKTRRVTETIKTTPLIRNNQANKNFFKGR